MRPPKLTDKDFFNAEDMSRRREYVQALTKFLDTVEDPAFQARYKRLGIGDKRDLHPTLKRLLDAFGGPDNILGIMEMLLRQVDASQPESRNNYDYNARRHYEIG